MTVGGGRLVNRGRLVSRSRLVIDRGRSVVSGSSMVMRGMGMVRDGRVVCCSMTMCDSLMASLVSSNHGKKGESDKSLFIFNEIIKNNYFWFWLSAYVRTQYF